jgi:hypothetical protein
MHFCAPIFAPKIDLGQGKFGFEVCLTVEGIPGLPDGIFLDQKSHKSRFWYIFEAIVMKYVCILFYGHLEYFTSILF